VEGRCIRVRVKVRVLREAAKKRSNSEENKHSNGNLSSPRSSGTTTMAVGKNKRISKSKKGGKKKM
jgi:hypothetical protein